MEKGEIAQNEQFHLFPQDFLCNLYLKSLYLITRRQYFRLVQIKRIADDILKCI